MLWNRLRIVWSEWLIYKSLPSPSSHALPFFTSKHWLLRILLLSPSQSLAFSHLLFPLLQPSLTYTSFSVPLPFPCLYALLILSLFSLPLLSTPLFPSHAFLTRGLLSLKPESLVFSCILFPLTLPSAASQCPPFLTLLFAFLVCALNSPHSSLPGLQQFSHVDALTVFSYSLFPLFVSSF